MLATSAQSSRFLLKISALVLLAFLPLLTSTTKAVDVVTDPVGFYKVLCYSNSDTAVSVPFTRIPEFRGLVGSVPSSTSLTITNSPGWTASQWVYNPGAGRSNTYYVVLVSGTKEGAWYMITANTTDTLTLSGTENTTGIVAGDAVRIIPFWTLNTMFPNGDGVVASTRPLAIKTVVKTFDFTAIGQNNPPGGAGNFIYVTGTSQWEPQSVSGSNVNNRIILPDEYVIVRNASFSGGGAGPTVTTNIAPGQVPTWKTRIPLFANSGTTTIQANEIALFRPAAQTLNESGLSNLFLQSTSLTTRDTLKLYAQNTGTINNGPGTGGNYLWSSTGWHPVGQFGVDAGTNVVFTPGSGVQIWKVATNAPNTTLIWVNQPNY